MYAVAVSISILGVVVVTLLALEIRSFTAGRTLISQRRLVLRLVAGALLLLLLAAVFVGLLLLNLGSPQERPRLFLVYWSCCLLGSLALVWIMLADLREVGTSYTERRHAMWREMARFVADQIAAAKGRGDGKGEGGE